MRTELVHNESLGAYRLSPTHPMQPERFLLAVELLTAWGLLGEDGGRGAAIDLREPAPADEELLLFAHSPEYVEFVRSASDHPDGAQGHGIGAGDTPAFPRMHEAAAAAVGATVQAARDVLLGSHASRAFNPSGGLHHAHNDYASGFCIYNDIVVAIEDALRQHARLRVAYVDIDAHHGDGVEAAFAERPEVLTISVHESGRYLFPGTGRASDIGTGAGAGSVINVPLPPFADARCYEAASASVIQPAVVAFEPDILFIQAGADSHRADPLTHLALDIAGYVGLIGSLVDLAESTCGGRIVMVGGGGYRPYDEVPRMWGSAACALASQPIPETLPASWLRMAEECASRFGGHAPVQPETLAESSPEPPEGQREMAWQATRTVIGQVREASPLLRTV